MSKYASINPADATPDTQSGFSNEFAALVNVKSSRYVKHEYNPDANIAPKVGIKWIMGTTKGNTFERTWSIGIPWEGNENNISADGKQFSGQIKKGSDGFYLLQKAVGAGYPGDKLTDDISVFENETFFMAQDVNPRSKGSARKIYPKQYHPEGWTVALEAALVRRAEREAKQNAPAYTAAGDPHKTTMTGSYAPPALVQTPDVVLHTAGEALVHILTVSGSTVNRAQLPAKLNAYVEEVQKATGKQWEGSFRQNVTVALWDMEQIKQVVANNPALKLDNETISFR